MSRETEIERLTERDSPAQRAAIVHAMDLSTSNWREFMASDPELAKLEVGIAHAERILVTEPYSSPQHACAVTESRRLRDARIALLRKRAGLDP